MAQEKILSEQEKESIYQSIVQIFGEEGAKTISFNLGQFKTTVDSVVAEMDLETTHSYIDRTGNKPIEVIRKQMSQSVTRRNYLAMKGYLLIFKFREFLLNERINYRYYYQDNDGITQSREFGDLDLLNLAQFSDVGIRLNSSKIKQDAHEGNQFFLTKMQQYINIYTNPPENDYMKVVGNQNLRVVRKHIMNKYGSQNEGLKNKTGTAYQTFNMGHIFESLDITLTDVFLNYEPSERDSHIDNYMFGKYLKRDNIIASKGADNFLSNTSIKSNEANLYSYNTIATQLYQIQQLLLLSSPIQIKEEIVNLFINTSGEKTNLVGNQLEQSSQKALNKLLSEIQKMFKQKT